MAGPGSPNCSPDQQSKPSGGRRRFIGVRQRPSGRWVAEIKDSSQRVRLWLGTYDAPEEAARAYDEAARALRGENARTNFATSPGSSQTDSPFDSGFGFSSLRARMSKNLQSILARAADGKASNTRVSDQITFASIFHHRSYGLNQCLVDMKSIEKAVQPSFVVPGRQAEGHVAMDHVASLTSDSSDSVGFIAHEVGVYDGPSESDVSEEEGRCKRFKVSSSVIVPPSFSASF